jgi:small subunit ribosomal protein S16
MAVKIRLKRMGTKRKPHFRIVVVDSRRARGGRAIEEVGYYDPSKNPAMVSLNKERIQYWLGVGAGVSPTLVSLFKKNKVAKP